PQGESLAYLSSHDQARVRPTLAPVCGVGQKRPRRRGCARSDLEDVAKQARILDRLRLRAGPSDKQWSRSSDGLSRSGAVSNEILSRDAAERAVGRQSHRTGVELPPLLCANA